MLVPASISLAAPINDIAARLAQTFAQTGFAIITDHGINPALIARAGTAMQAFFALPQSIKDTCHVPGQGGARGYTPFGRERAKGAAAHDLKEFFHMGRDVSAGDPLAAMMPDNIWPEQLADFRAASEALFAAFEATGARVLEAVALGLGLDPEFFAPSILKGNSVMRYLHYPPLGAGASNGGGEYDSGGDDRSDHAIRAAAHEDINAITLLLGAQEAGLELRTREGEWLAIEPPPGGLVVNIGDMLQRLTAGRLRSTTHRVVNPRREASRRSRYSMPFFLHFRPDYLIEPIFDGGEAAITADAYLQQRLREIGLA